MKYCFYFYILLILLLPFTSQAQAHTKIFNGATLIDPVHQTVTENSVIILEGERIQLVGKGGEVKLPADAEIIEARGKWIIPGLIDSHIHFFQSGGLYTRPDIIDLRKYVDYETQEVAAIENKILDTFSRYLASGVTGVADMGGPYWNFSVRELAEKTELAPRVAITGPLISTYQPQLLMTKDPPILKVNSIDEARALVEKEAAFKPDYIKIWFIVRPNETINQHLPLIQATIEESHKKGFRVAVHATEKETAMAAVMAGADILVHGVCDQDVDENFFKILKEKGVIYTSTIVVFEGYENVLFQKFKISLRNSELARPDIVASLFDLKKLPLSVVPAERMEKMKKSSTIAHLKKNLFTAQKVGVSIAAGTDAGNIGTFHGSSIFRELELMAEAGLTPAELLQSVTWNGALVMGREKELGSIEAGKLADFLILSANPLENIKNIQHIETVVKNGKIYKPENLIPNTSEDIVQRQVNAYNSRDLPLFLSFYSPNIKVFEQSGKQLLSGKPAMEQGYKELFDRSPNLHTDIVERMILGKYVIDKEHVIGMRGNNVVDAVAIYEVKDHFIENVWFLKP